jgi:hypothetical protein
MPGCYTCLGRANWLWCSTVSWSWVLPKFACCSGKSVAVICLQEVDMWQCAGWALVKLLLPCVGCCANAGESALVLPYGSASDMADEWFSQKGGDTFLMVFKSRWRLLGFDLSTINALG